MQTKRILPAVIVAALLGSASMLPADEHDPVEQREAAMRTFGKSAKAIGDMLKGETELDAGAANAAMADMQAAAEGLGELFPEGTAGAGENEFAAGEKIWTDRAGFEATLAALQEDIAAGVAANPQSKEEIAAAFGAIAENCQTCHETYRIKK